jgi:hypothetical protein
MIRKDTASGLRKKSKEDVIPKAGVSCWTEESALLPAYANSESWLCFGFVLRGFVDR